MEHIWRRIPLCCLLILSAACVSHAGEGLQITTSANADIETQWTATALRLAYTTQQSDSAEPALLSIHVRLPHPPRWAWLDDRPIPPERLHSEGDGRLQLDVPTGSHIIRAGWAEPPVLIERKVGVPVTVDGARVGVLDGRLRSESLQVFGAVDVGQVGLYRVRATAAAGAEPESVSLRVGDTTVASRFSTTRTLLFTDSVPAGGRTALQLSVRGGNLSASRVTALDLRMLTPATVAPAVAQAPPNAMLIEAEAFARGSSSGYQVSPGSHTDTHGDSCVFSFLGDGSWLEWDIDVPADGRYDLYARIATAEPYAYRQMRMGTGRGVRRGLIAFPGTGGWGHSADSWGLRQITGVDGVEPLELEQGTRTLRLTGVLANHLNIDYLLLVPRE